MRTIKEAKSRMKVGARLLCVENTYRPELNGTIRVVTKMGATRWQWKFEGKEDERPSHSVWPTGIKIIDADTIKIPMPQAGVNHSLTLRFLSERTGPAALAKAAFGPMSEIGKRIRGLAGKGGGK